MTRFRPHWPRIWAYVIAPVATWAIVILFTVRSCS